MCRVRVWDVRGVAARCVECVVGVGIKSTRRFLWSYSARVAGELRRPVPESDSCQIQAEAGARAPPRHFGSPRGARGDGEEEEERCGGRRRRVQGEDKKAPKPTSVSRLVPDPEDIKHDVNRLLGALRAPNKSMSRGDAALFLWDIALNDKNERARLSMEDVAVAAVAAMRKGDHLARSAAASSWPRRASGRRPARASSPPAPPRALRHPPRHRRPRRHRSRPPRRRRGPPTPRRHRRPPRRDVPATQSPSARRRRSTQPERTRARRRDDRALGNARGRPGDSPRVHGPRAKPTRRPRPRVRRRRGRPRRDGATRLGSVRRRRAHIRPRPPPPSPPRCGASRISPRTSTAARRCPRTRSSSGCSWRR